MIDDAALQVRVVVVGLEHEKLGAAGPIHRIASFGWERETLFIYGDKKERENVNFYYKTGTDGTGCVPLNRPSRRRRHCCNWKTMAASTADSIANLPWRPAPRKRSGRPHIRKRSCGGRTVGSQLWKPARTFARETKMWRSELRKNGFLVGKYSSYPDHVMFPIERRQFEDATPVQRVLVLRNGNLNQQKTMRVAQF